MELKAKPNGFWMLFFYQIIVFKEVKDKKCFYKTLHYLDLELTLQIIVFKELQNNFW